MTTTQNDHSFHKICLEESASICPHNDSAFPVCWSLTCTEMTFRCHKVLNTYMLVHDLLHVGVMGGAFPIFSGLICAETTKFRVPLPKPPIASRYDSSYRNNEDLP